MSKFNYNNNALRDTAYAAFLSNPESIDEKTNLLVDLGQWIVESFDILVIKNAWAGILTTTMLVGNNPSISDVFRVVSGGMTKVLKTTDKELFNTPEWTIIDAIFETFFTIGDSAPIIDALKTAFVFIKLVLNEKYKTDKERSRAITETGNSQSK